MQITAPKVGQEVAGDKGVKISGTACDLGGPMGWLFDFDPEDGYYYPTDDGRPVVRHDGGLSFFDKPIGDKGDDHKTYTVARLVLQRHLICRLAYSASS
jgi:hypothetical protein